MDTIRSMVKEICWVCDLTFFIPQTFHDRRKADGQRFSCPAGCGLRYGESEAEKLQKDLDFTKRRADSNWRMYEGASRQAKRYRTMLKKCEGKKK